VTDKTFELPISSLLKDELIIRGYSTVGMLQRLSIFEAIRIPWMNGKDWQTISRAVGRKPFPDV